jgi:DNA adenine methylase
VLVYADPPYSTRSSRKRYRHEYSEADHARLIATLKALPVAVMRSGYPSPLYDELLHDWRTVEFQVMTRGGPRTEKLWMNYAPNAVHWATYAGKNFTRRQHVKCKAARWASNYRKLPAAERLAVLAALLNADCA